MKDFYPKNTVVSHVRQWVIWHVWQPLPWNMLWHIIEKYSMTQTLAMKYSQTCLSDHLYITTSFVSRLYLFLPSVFPCIRPLVRHVIYCTFLLCVTTYFMASVWVRHVIYCTFLLCVRTYFMADFGKMSVLPSWCSNCCQYPSSWYLHDLLTTSYSQSPYLLLVHNNTY
jgi:hypothetical protein